MEQLSPHFSRSEMACPCCGICNVEPSLLTALEALRGLLNRPVVITSACRCPAHNEAVGGVPGSQHVTTDAKPCLAADIHVEGMDGEELADYAELIAGFRDGGIGTGLTWIHADVRGYRARWSYDY